VARALIHNPELLVLDEPNSGLDPRARFEMKEILKNLGAMGKTVIISSHILPELSELCSSIGIIERGRMIVSGKVDEVMQQSQGNRPIRMRAYVTGMDDKNEANEYIVQVLKEQPLVSKVNLTEDDIYIGYEGADKEAAALLKSLMERNISVYDFYREKEDLEALFLEITGGDHR
jgi:ABC-2 type transport system ATP-binding protein